MQKPPITRPTLTPCPCGAENIALAHTTGDHYAQDFAVCQACGRQGPGEFGIDDAINAWNKMLETLTPQAVKPKDRVKLGLSPSCNLSEIDARKTD